MSATTAELTVPAGSARAATAILLHAAGVAIDTVRRRRAARAQRRVLLSLSEHILKDIGIGPHEVDAIVAERRARAGRLAGIHQG